AGFLGLCFWEKLLEWLWLRFAAPLCGAFVADFRGIPEAHSLFLLTCFQGKSQSYLFHQTLPCSISELQLFLLDSQSW
ncbi:MAG TPA: hypothetical protein PLI59_18885, partial [Candidatus Obscuribacter sp.]|nr:hypothetical protein [Candidatus Obscuribacter sp.]